MARDYILELDDFEQNGRLFPWAFLQAFLRAADGCEVSLYLSRTTTKADGIEIKPFLFSEIHVQLSAFMP
jgi:hypothetical protein